MEWQWWFFNSSSNYCCRWFLDTIASPSINPYQWVDELPFPPFPHEIKVNPSYLALMQLSGTRCHLLKRKKRPETNGDENLLLSGNYLFSEEGQRKKTRIGFAIEYITLIFVCFFRTLFYIYTCLTLSQLNILLSYIFVSSMYGILYFIFQLHLFWCVFWSCTWEILLFLKHLLVLSCFIHVFRFVGSIISFGHSSILAVIEHVGFCFVESTISNSFIFVCYQGFYKDFLWEFKVKTIKLQVFILAVKTRKTNEDGNLALRGNNLFWQIQTSNRILRGGEQNIVRKCT